MSKPDQSNQSMMKMHVFSIAVKNNIELIFKYSASARAYRRDRSIVLQPVKSNVTYYVALHELGHILGPNPGIRLEQEVSAWRWALENAHYEPTPATWRAIYRALNSYMDRANRWKNMKLPPEDHDFWALLREAESNLWSPHRDRIDYPQQP